MCIACATSNRVYTIIVGKLIKNRKTRSNSRNMSKDGLKTGLVIGLNVLLGPCNIKTIFKVVSFAAAW